MKLTYTIDLLYKRYYQKVYGYALVKTNCTCTSKDIAQEVFLKLMLNKDRLHDVQNLDCYIYRMTRNQFLNYCRKYKRMRTMDENWWSERMNEGYTTHEQLLERECRKTLATAIQRLPTGERLAYELRSEFDLSTDDIAKLVKRSPNTVKEQIREGRKKVRKWMLVQVA